MELLDLGFNPTVPPPPPKKQKNKLKDLSKISKLDPGAGHIQSRAARPVEGSGFRCDAIEPGFRAWGCASSFLRHQGQVCETLKARKDLNPRSPIKPSLSPKL